MTRRPKPLRRLTCPGCKQQFTALRSTAKTCSDACRAKVWKVRTGYVHPATLAKTEKTTKSVGINTAPEGGEDQKENFPIC